MIRDIYFPVFEQITKIAKLARQRRLMAKEGIASVRERRLPHVMRDWTGDKADQTSVRGTPEDWYIVARGKDEKFDELGFSETSKEAPKDLFLIYRKDHLFFLGT